MRKSDGGSLKSNDMEDVENCTYVFLKFQSKRFDQGDECFFRDQSRGDFGDVICTTVIETTFSKSALRPFQLSQHHERHPTHPVFNILQAS